MKHLVVGTLALLLGAWGLVTWFDTFGIVMRGLVPILLVVFGLVALLAGYRNMSASAGQARKRALREEVDALEDEDEDEDEALDDEDEALEDEDEDEDEGEDEALEDEDEDEDEDEALEDKDEDEDEGEALEDEAPRATRSGEGQRAAKP